MFKYSRKLERLLARIKQFLKIMTLVAFSMALWILLSANALNDWPDNDTIGTALLLIYIYAVMCFYKDVVMCFYKDTAPTPRLDRALRYARYLAAVAATALAMGAMIEFAIHGAPPMDWPLQNEWRARFVALVIIAVGAVILVPPALAWGAEKMGDLS